MDYITNLFAKIIDACITGLVTGISILWNAIITQPIVLIVIILICACKIIRKRK